MKPLTFEEESVSALCASLEPEEIDAFDTSEFSTSRKLFVCASVNLAQRMVTYAFDNGGKTISTYLD
jgi:hypothetical protein